MTKAIRTTPFFCAVLALLLGVAGCGDMPEAGDACSASQQGTYECGSGSTILRCQHSGGEQIWVQVDACPSRTHCNVTSGGRSYSCPAN